MVVQLNEVGIRDRDAGVFEFAVARPKASFVFVAHQTVCVDQIAEHES